MNADEYSNNQLIRSIQLIGIGEPELIEKRLWQPQFERPTQSKVFFLNFRLFFCRARPVRTYVSRTDFPQQLRDRDNKSENGRKKHEKREGRVCMSSHGKKRKERRRLTGQQQQQNKIVEK